MGDETTYGRILCPIPSQLVGFVDGDETHSLRINIAFPSWSGVLYSEPKNYTLSREWPGNIGEILHQTPQSHLGHSAIWSRTFDLPRASRDTVGQAYPHLQRIFHLTSSLGSAGGRGATLTRIDIASK